MFKVYKKTQEQCQWRRSGNFIVKLEHISQFVDTTKLNDVET